MRLVLPSMMLVSCALLTACPGDDGSTTGADPTTASTSTSMPGTASTVDPGTTTNMGMTSMPSGGVDSSGSGDAMCPDIPDAAASGVVSIEITNARAEGVWIEMDSDCYDNRPYRIDYDDLRSQPYRPPTCGTCADAAQGQCPCPPPFCDEQTALYLEPGVTVAYEWEPLVYPAAQVPMTCPGYAECGGTCRYAVEPTRGSYAFSVRVGDATGCATEPCACMPVDGSCTIFDPGLSLSNAVDVVQTIGLPGDAQVVLTIE